MKKPPDIVHGLEEAPPPVVTILSGVQHVALIAINLVYPLLVFRVAETPTQTVVDLVGAGMLVLAAATLLQALRFGPLGSGFMCPAVFTATYLGPSLIAAKLGGLPLVFGMTIFAGFLEAALAPLLNRLRPIFPPEISGVVIFMIGLSASIAGLRLMLGGTEVPVTSGRVERGYDHAGNDDRPQRLGPRNDAHAVRSGRLGDRLHCRGNCRHL